jgi:Tfp pilus assembly protein PilF
MNGFRGPIYYLLIGIPSRLLALVLGESGYPPPPGIEFLVGKMLSVLAAVLILASVGGIAFGALRKHGGTLSHGTCLVGALIVQLVLASNTTFIDHTYRASSDLPAVAFAAGAVFLVLRARVTSAFVVAGIAAGLAYLTRYNNLLLFPGLLLACLILPSNGPSRKARALALAGGVVIVCIPWWLFLAQSVGDPFFNRNAVNAAIAVFTVDRISIDRFMAADLPFDSLLDVLRANAARTTQVWLTHLSGHVSNHFTELIGWPVALASCVGWAVLILRSPHRRIWLCLLMLWGFTILSLVPAFFTPRIALPVAPFYAIGAGGLVLLLPSTLVERAAYRRLLHAIIGCLFVVSTVRGTILAEDETRVPQPEEIQLLRDDLLDRDVRLDPDGSCAARKPHAVYWLGLQPASLPFHESLEQIVESLRRSGTRYLFVGSSAVVHRPALAPLGDPESLARIPNGLRLLGHAIRWKGDLGSPAALYEVEGVDPSNEWRLTAVQGIHRPPQGLSRTVYVRFCLGRMYLRCGLTAHATPYLLDAVARAPDYRPSREWAGDLFYFSGDDVRAQQQYEEAKRLDPSVPSVWSRLAAVHATRGDFARADSAIVQALQLTRDSARRHPAALGEHFFNEKEHGAAIAPLLFAVNDDPEDWRSCRLLGFIAREIQQDSELAARFFELALQSMPVGTERAQLESMLRDLRSSGGP